jgi:hypothetical protein
MKLVYIIAQGHSGSTLLDCILGTHPDFLSSGELCYLNWQIARTMNKISSVEDQDICSCGKDFRDCLFWSEVFASLKDKTGHDIISNPRSFDTAFFNQFSFNNMGGFKQGKLNKYFGKISKELLILGYYPYCFVNLFYPKLKRQIKNKWTLYETMAEVGSKNYVIDSSKRFLEALLLYNYKPNNVILVFLHRSIAGLAASSKRLAEKKGKIFNIQTVKKGKSKFEKRILLIKKNLPGNSFIDIDYEDYVKRPASFLNYFSEVINASSDFPQQQDDDLYIDPSELHLVAGNPMRYKGKQKITIDLRFQKELSKEELMMLQK